MSEVLQTIQARRRQTLGDRIKRRRQELELTQIELAQSAKITQGFLSSIEGGRRHPGPQTLRVLADALGIPVAVIIGEGPEHDNPQPLDTRELPLFGSIPAGPPSQSQDASETYPVLLHLWSPDHYCLRLAMDSMEPTLKPCDVVLVHYRPNVNPLHVQGKICACLVDGSPTLKRVMVENVDESSRVVLRGDNPDSEPIFITSKKDFSIQGVVVKLVSREL